MLMCVVAGTGCGGEDETKNAVPIGPADGPMGGGVMVGGSEGSGSGGSSSGDSGSSTGSPAVVVSGRFVDGDGGYFLPIQCAVRFHGPDEINPNTGVEFDTTFSYPFTIEDYPQSFVVTIADIGGGVSEGDLGFVTAQCDVDGDNFFDDAAGAYFPTLPMTEVELPVSNLELSIGPI